MHLSYFSNFVLLGSFLGIGLGFLISRKRWSVLPFTPVILALLVIFVLLDPVTVRPGRQRGHLLHLAEHPAVRRPGWCCRSIFVLVAAVLAGPAEVVGRCFAQLAPADRLPLGPGRLADRHRHRSPCCRSSARPSVVWGIVVTICLVMLIDGWPRFLGAVAGAGDDRRR